MADRETYNYAVLRYVHDVMTGEFVNVGVVLHAPSGLRSRFRSTYGRVSSVFPGLDERAFLSALKAVQFAIERLEKNEATAGLLKSAPDALAFARQALAPDDSSFQWSPPGSGITRDAAKSLDQLYDRFVSQHEKHGARRRDDADVWKPIRARLEELQVADRFEERTFRGASDELKLEHAWKNGKWHAIEPVSLDLSGVDEVKKKIHRLRGHFDMAADGMVEDLSLHIVLGKPSNPDLDQAYEWAKGALAAARLQPKVVSEDEVDKLIIDLADEIRLHSHL